MSSLVPLEPSVTIVLPDYVQMVSYAPNCGLLGIQLPDVGQRRYDEASRGFVHHAWYAACIKHGVVMRRRSTSSTGRDMPYQSAGPRLEDAGPSFPLFPDWELLVPCTTTEMVAAVLGALTKAFHSLWAPLLMHAAEPIGRHFGLSQPLAVVDCRPYYKDCDLTPIMTAPVPRPGRRVELGPAGPDSVTNNQMGEGMPPPPIPPGAWTAIDRRAASGRWAGRSDWARYRDDIQSAMSDFDRRVRSAAPGHSPHEYAHLISLVPQLLGVSGLDTPGSTLVVLPPVMPEAVDVFVESYLSEFSGEETAIIDQALRDLASRLSAVRPPQNVDGHSTSAVSGIGGGGVGSGGPVRAGLASVGSHGHLSAEAAAGSQAGHEAGLAMLRAAQERAAWPRGHDGPGATDAEVLAAIQQVLGPAAEPATGGAAPSTRQRGVDPAAEGSDAPGNHLSLTQIMAARQHHSTVNALLNVGLNLNEVDALLADAASRGVNPVELARNLRALATNRPPGPGESAARRHTHNTPTLTEHSPDANQAAMPPFDSGRQGPTP